MECPLISGIQKVVLYETKARYYVVGSNQKQTAFRVLKIDRTEPKELHIQDDEHTYDSQQINTLVTMLAHGNQSASKQKQATGLTKTQSAYGIVGFVRFLEGYYMILITQRSKKAQIGGHAIYKIEDTTMLYIPNDSVRYTHPDEARYVKMFQSVDLSSNFYFSYSYDLTHTLQYNMATALDPNKQTPDIFSDTGQNKPGTPDVNTKGPCETNSQSKHTDKQDVVYGIKTKPTERFVWNKHLLKHFETEVHHDWVLHIIYGFIDQYNLFIFGKAVYITLIARRSNEFAGTRFLKRGANSQGAVANEVETEQIVYDSSLTQLNKSKLSSFVQMRGSIPVYWSQDISKMMAKPPITIDQRDPYFHMAGIHFNKCLKRYGAPILLLNLVKRREKRPHESLLCEEYSNCKTFLNQFLPPDQVMKYIGFDMAHYTKRKTNNVLDKLARISRYCVKQSGFYFHCPNLKEDFWKQREFDGVGGHKTQTGSRQMGTVRTNCVDCLDRTNTAQFAVGKCALAYQLCALGVLGSPELEFDTDCLKILEDLYEDQGDTVALQYGGSQLVHRIEGYRKIATLKAHSNDILQTLSRYYSNTFSDVEKQQATNVFLGFFVPKEHQPNIWDLTTDFYLHFKDAHGEKISRRSYTNWCEHGVFDCLPLPYEEEHKSENCSAVVKTFSNDERVDSFFEYYRPDELTNFEELYSFNIPNSIRNFMPKKSDNFSPFKRRKSIDQQGSDTRRLAAMYKTLNGIHFLESRSYEQNPNISGKDSTSSLLSNTSEDGSTSSGTNVEGDVDAMSSSEYSTDTDTDDVPGEWSGSEDNLYGLDLNTFMEDEQTQDIYKKYVSLGVSCLEPSNVSWGANLSAALDIKPVDEYRSDIYCVEEPSVSKRSTDLYIKYVKCGNVGATNPPEANKQIYKNYVKQLFM